MADQPVTREQALAKARDWAESAHRCYARSGQADQDAERRASASSPLIGDQRSITALRDRAATERADAVLELDFARTWAAIAAATDAVYSEEQRPEDGDR
jgi:hypothetical protein